MNKPTDFNDMAALQGQEAVKAAIATATVATPATATHAHNWPEPQPLVNQYEPQPYPIDALPDKLRAAVEEVAAFVKAPLPMVATSALSAVSLAAQALFDVKRAEKLTSPIGVYTLIIADSGERKPTCDGFFMQAIRDHEKQAQEAGKPLQADYRADLASWEAEYNGIKDKIRQLAKESKNTEPLKRDLKELEHDKPEPPRIARCLYSDITPEEMAYKLAKVWPSAGLVSAEAGVVFGSHAMSSDTVMRSFGALNQLWDGNELRIDRRTSESFSVIGARLTVALQVQPDTLRAFSEKSGQLARGTGFFARFLLAWPDSTQGYRRFEEAPRHWPKLSAFNQRITDILNQDIPINDNGSLSPKMLGLSTGAKAAWIDYFNGVEEELRSGGELFDVRDVASKSADNAARLAALFHVFAGGQGDTSQEAMEQACRIAAWHLSESRRFFGELALPTEVSDATRLDRWLTKYCQRERTHYVNKRYTQQHSVIRDSGRLKTALEYLESLERIRLGKEGKQSFILLNPKLLSEGVTQ